MYQWWPIALLLQQLGQQRMTYCQICCAANKERKRDQQQIMSYITVAMVYSVCILDSIKLGLDYILDNCPSNVNRKSTRLQKDIMLINK